MNRLTEVAALFLRLGFTAFGGPAAHIAIMHDEVVKRRKWLTDERFLDLLGATNLIPGPNSTEMAIHISFVRAGWPGLIVGGMCFILPAMLIVLGGASVLALYFLRVNEIALLFAGGMIYMLIANFQRLRNPSHAVLFPLGSLVLTQPSVAFSLPVLFLTFLKIGSVLYGSGYVLLAFLRADLVLRLGWLTDQQLLDAVGVGQVTPGPVFTTATFIGYILGGTPGALLATLGIFLPSFIFVAISNPLIPRIRDSAWMSSLLDGVNAASLGMMAAVTLQLAGSSLIDFYTALIAIVSLILLLRYKLNSTWLMAGGALAGFLISFFR